MLQAVLKHTCIFCGTPTNFEDNQKAYCIDCYCKLRNSAHTHDAPESLPKPLPISPMPGVTVPSMPMRPYEIGDYPNKWGDLQITCTTTTKGVPFYTQVDTDRYPTDGNMVIC